MLEERDLCEQTMEADPDLEWVPAIKVLSGPQKGVCVEVAGTSFSIGRDRNSHLILNNKAISRRHAIIEKHPGGYKITDQKSRWGMKVNGEHLPQAELKFGDEIEIVGTLMSFNLESRNALTKQKKKNWMPIVAAGLAAVAMILAGIFFYLHHESAKTLDRPGADVVSKIIYHYDRGINHYNKINEDETNREKAVEEMKKVIELDPDGKTQFSRSARRIIDGLEP